MSGSDDWTWELYARSKPYFSVITSKKYLSKNLSKCVKEEFFSSGKDYLNSVVAVINESICSDFRPRRSLDFGCGVGRIVLPLSKLSKSVTGVDVSLSMLSEARKNCPSSHVNFMLTKDFLNSKETFDFIHSSITFQHISSKTGFLLFEECLSKLDSSGVGVFHFIHGTRFSIKSVLHFFLSFVSRSTNFVNYVFKKSIFKPSMRMYFYDKDVLIDILKRNDCVVKEIKNYDQWFFRGSQIYFQKS